jgi:predicted ester cyclase
MSEGNKALVRRLFEATNAKDVEALRALYAPRFLLNGVETSFEEFAGGFPAFFAAFPDARGVVEEWIAEGHRVAARWRTEATHAGEYAGAQATGRRVSWQGTNTYRIEDGRVVEMWQSADILGLLQQIDAVSLNPKTARRQQEGGIFRFQMRPGKNGEGA